MVWFVANETFREKLKKCSFVFCKLFAKLNEAKNAKTMQDFAKKYFTKNSHFAKAFSRKPRALKLYLVFFAFFASE